MTVTPLHPAQTVERHAGEVLDVAAAWCGPRKAPPRSGRPKSVTRAGDFEIAAVVADLAHQRERALPAPAVHLHLNLGRWRPSRLQPASPVGQLADARLQRGVHVVDDVGVQADARHQQEMARNAPAVAGHVAHRNAPRVGSPPAARRRAPDGCPASSPWPARWRCRPGRMASGTSEWTMPSATSLMVPSPPAARIRSAPRAMCSARDGAGRARTRGGAPP